MTFCFFLMTPAYCLVFRRIFCKGIEDRSDGRCLGICQDCDRRLCFLPHHILKHIIKITRPFYQHKLWLFLLQICSEEQAINAVSQKNVDFSSLHRILSYILSPAANKSGFKHFHPNPDMLYKALTMPILSFSSHFPDILSRLRYLFHHL